MHQFSDCVAHRNLHLAPLRADVPERHFDLRAVQFAARRAGLQRRDVPAGAAHSWEELESFLVISATVVDLRDVSVNCGWTNRRDATHRK